jgi:uncharacterized protein (DUF983 family)
VAICKPLASGRLLITAQTRAWNFWCQFSRWAAWAMAAMLEPLPEIKITMLRMVWIITKGHNQAGFAAKSHGRAK